MTLRPGYEIYLAFMKTEDQISGDFYHDLEVLVAAEVKQFKMGIVTYILHETMKAEQNGKFAKSAREAGNLFWFHMREHNLKMREYVINGIRWLSNTESSLQQTLGREFIVDATNRMQLQELRDIGEAFTEEQKRVIMLAKLRISRDE